MSEVRRGIAGRAGAEMTEKPAIRKCFLVCCEGVSAIFNIWRLAIRNQCCPKKVYVVRCNCLIEWR
jgi:hypothetical protein